MEDEQSLEALAARLALLERRIDHLSENVEAALAPWQALNTIGKGVRWLAALLALLAAIVGLLKFGTMEPPK